MGRYIGHCAVEPLVYVKGRAQCDDGMKWKSAVFQTFVDRGLLLCMPLDPPRQDHVHRTAPEILSLRKDLASAFADDQSPEVWESEDLVEAESREIRRTRRIAQIQRSGRHKRRRIKEGVYIPSRVTGPSYLLTPPKRRATPVHIRLSRKREQFGRLGLYRTQLRDPRIDLAVREKAPIAHLRDLAHPDQARVRINMIPVPEAVMRRVLQRISNQFNGGCGIRHEHEVEFLGVRIEEAQCAQTDIVYPVRG